MGNRRSSGNLKNGNDRFLIKRDQNDVEEIVSSTKYEFKLTLTINNESTVTFQY